MADLPHALEKKWRSLADLQSLILGGKFGNIPGKLKPLDNLVSNLQEELQARHISTEGKKARITGKAYRDSTRGTKGTYYTNSKPI